MRGVDSVIVILASAWDIIGHNVYDVIHNLMYVALVLQIIWGFYCTVMVWMRIDQKRFRTEADQEAFLGAIEEPLAKGEYTTAAMMCEGDRRALVQLAQLSIESRQLGYAKVKQLITDRLRRDILADIDFGMTWISTMVKSGPMVGLLGTVMAMMSAFGKFATEKNVEPGMLAGDIKLALITTAGGLFIAITMLLSSATVNIRVRAMQELIGHGLNQFLEVFKEALIRHPR